MKGSPGRRRGWRNFQDAGRGFASACRTEWNVRIHLAALVAVVVSGFLLRISAGEWSAVLLSAGLVLAAELFNTALEYLADAVHPDEHPLVGRAKDAGAAAVLIAALAAAVVGGIVFLPKLWERAATWWTG